MTPGSAIATARAAGATLVLDGDTLKARGPIPAAVLAELRDDAHLKAAVMIVLRYLEDEPHARLQGRLWNGARMLWEMERAGRQDATYVRGLQLLSGVLVLYEEAAVARGEVQA